MIYFYQIQCNADKILQLIAFVRENGMSGEDWKEVPHTGGSYYISSAGRFLSLKRDKPRIMSQWNNKGYLCVSLSVNGKKKNRRVHRLVAQAFCADYSPNKQVHHKDYDRRNNTAINLLPITPGEHILLHQKAKK